MSRLSRISRNETTGLRWWRRLAPWLAAAVVLAQGLGLVHRVAHGDSVAARLAQRPSAPAASPGELRAEPAVASHKAPPAAWLQALFAGHDRDQSCDAYDQMSHGDAAVGRIVVAAVVVPAAPATARYASHHIAAQARGFLARGPPALS